MFVRKFAAVPTRLPQQRRHSHAPRTETNPVPTLGWAEVNLQNNHRSDDHILGRDYDRLLVA